MFKRLSFTHLKGMSLYYIAKLIIVRVDFSACVNSQVKRCFCAPKKESRPGDVMPNGRLTGPAQRRRQRYSRGLRLQVLFDASIHSLGDEDVVGA